MGKYINQDSKGTNLPLVGKAAALIADGAVIIDTPTVWSEDLVNVVGNGAFDAAAYAYSEKEMSYFRDTPDHRPKVWLKYAHAKELAK